MAKNIYDDIGRPSKRHLAKIVQLTEPLRMFLGVDRFWRNMHWKDGSYSVIGNYPETAEVFFGKNLFQGHPYFRNPVFYQSGFALPELLNNREYESTQGRLKGEGDCFHVFIVIRKHGEDFIEYGFATSHPRPGMENLYINHLPSINKFIDYFEANAVNIIREADEFRINISELIGKKFDENPKLNNNIMVPDHELMFLSKIDKNADRMRSLLTLTKSEKTCLKLYLGGLTYIEVGKKLFRSPRTVEHHIENAKLKLGINTRSELFDALAPYLDLILKN